MTTWVACIRSFIENTEKGGRKLFAPPSGGGRGAAVITDGSFMVHFHEKATLRAIAISCESEFHSYSMDMLLYCNPFIEL